MALALTAQRTVREAPAGARDPVRVFLCDDIPELRTLMRYAIEEDPRMQVVGEAANCAEAVNGVVSRRADVILLDPGTGGLQTIPRVRAAAPDCKIIVLSGFSERRVGAQVRRVGAHGYIEKGESFAGIRRALRDAVG